MASSYHPLLPRPPSPLCSFLALYLCIASGLLCPRGALFACPLIEGLAPAFSPLVSPPSVPTNIHPTHRRNEDPRVTHKGHRLTQARRSESSVRKQSEGKTTPHTKRPEKSACRGVDSSCGVCTLQCMQRLQLIQPNYSHRSSQLTTRHRHRRTCESAAPLQGGEAYPYENKKTLPICSRRYRYYRGHFHSYMALSTTPIVEDACPRAPT